MSTTEKAELALILIIGILCWFIAPIFPEKITIGRLLLTASSILLFQSLLRDLWILIRARHVEQVGSSRAAQCMCMESTIGVTGVLIGGIFLGIGFDQAISIAQWGWNILVIFILCGGFLVKDYILEWNPWRIRREKDHMNIVFTWKK